jgi:hypothetical protein
VLRQIRPDWALHLIQGAGHPNSIMEQDFKVQLKAALDSHRVSIMALMLDPRTRDANCPRSAPEPFGGTRLRRIRIETLEEFGNSAGSSVKGSTVTTLRQSVAPPATNVVINRVFMVGFLLSRRPTEVRQ